MTWDVWHRRVWDCEGGDSEVGAASERTTHETCEKNEENVCHADEKNAATAGDDVHFDR